MRLFDSDSLDTASSLVYLGMWLLDLRLWSQLQSDVLAWVVGQLVGNQDLAVVEGRQHSGVENMVVGFAAEVDRQLHLFRQPFENSDPTTFLSEKIPLFQKRNPSKF